MNYKKAISIIVCFGVLLSLWSCSDTACNSFEREIKSRCVKVDSVYSFSVSSLTDFKWDELYIITGPRFPDEVKEITGIKYGKLIDDDSRQYIFVRENEIVKEFSSRCGSLTYDRVENDTGYVVYRSAEQILVKKQNNEGEMYYTAVKK